MLPGLKFLFATVVLSLSVLIFGLGAAALLRSAHDEFTSMPSWRTAQTPMIAVPFDTARLETLKFEPKAETRKSEPPTQTLSMLRVEPPAPPPADIKAEPKAEIKSEIKPETKIVADDTKVAAINPQAVTDGKPDIAANAVQVAKPVVRKRRAAVKRKRIVRRAQTAVTAQQPSFNSDPFSGTFGVTPQASAGRSR